jgi:plasmid stabilization system protein ParE
MIGNYIPAITQNFTKNMARKVFDKIVKEIELLTIDEIKTKVSPELKDIGINDIYQLTINPWIVYYKINEENKMVKILLILDGRRNIERILIDKVIDNKL